MIQNLLADRFKLKFHRETKILPVYVLIVGEKGPRMKPCEPGAAYAVRSGRAPLKFSRMTTVRLAPFLPNELGRTVVDLPGLPGNYDITMDWTPDRHPSAGPDNVSSLDIGRGS